MVSTNIASLALNGAKGANKRATVYELIKMKDLHVILFPAMHSNAAIGVNSGRGLVLSRYQHFSSRYQFQVKFHGTEDVLDGTFTVILY